MFFFLDYAQHAMLELKTNIIVKRSICICLMVWSLIKHPGTVSVHSSTQNGMRIVALKVF